MFTDKIRPFPGLAGVVVDQSQGSDRAIIKQIKANGEVVTLSQTEFDALIDKNSRAVSVAFGLNPDGTEKKN